MNIKILSIKKIADSENGALLLGIIVTIVIFAVLGAAMLYITSTSTFTQVYGNDAAKAYYMAESGYRYASMNIVTLSKGGDNCLNCHSSHGKETLRHSAGYAKLPDDMIRVHGQTYPQDGQEDLFDGGGFTVCLAPYWFKAGKDSLTGNVGIGFDLTVFAIKHSTGAPQCNFPEEFKNNKINDQGGGGLYIDGKYVQYSSINVNIADKNNKKLIFKNVNPDNISLPENDNVFIDIFPACLAGAQPGAIKPGDDLLINVSAAELYAFPDTKSVIEIHSVDADGNPVIHQLSYKNVAILENKFTCLENVNDNVLDGGGLSINAGDIVSLSKTLKATSTGTYSEASKTLEYYRWVGQPLTVPIVYNTAKPDKDKLLAGGNFHWVEYADDNKGHNIFQNNGDNNLNKAPGDSGFAGCGQSCHKKLSFGKPNDYGYSCNVCHFDPHPSNNEDDIWYRFISIDHWDEGAMGAEGIEHEKWNYDAEPDSHNEYLGKELTGGFGFDGGLGNTTTAYCTGCHGFFHSEQKEGDEWMRHPSDWTIPNAGEFADAFGADGTGTGTYDPDVPVARTNLDVGVSDKVTLGSDMVMCLTCHHAHGSPYDDSLRWNTNSRDSSINKCIKCHTDKTSELHKPGKSADCRSCHTMHDGTNVNLLK